MSDFKKFAAAVTRKKFEKIYFIHGDEDYFVSKASDLLIENAVEPGERSFNLDIFDGTETTSEAILSSMLSFPFVGARRLTLIRRFDKMDKKYRLDVADHILDLPDTNILCIIAGEIKLSEEPYKKLSAVAETLTFNRLKGADLSEFVSETAASLGKELSAGAVELLIDFTGDSVGDLSAELEKLNLYVGDKKNVDIDDITAAVGKSRTFNFFELQRAIGQRNSKRAQEIASKMLENGEKPVYINFMLSRYFLNLLQMKHLAAKGINSKDISTDVFGKWNPFINEYTSAAKIFSIKEIKDALASLLDVDMRLKTGGYSDVDAMVVVISEITGKAASSKV
ncbi:MAG TPA: DNA polymerase III subunit delta [Candidatus Acidoferrales bacterium]|nr:DNA polymerase III subunit delta [Candidatus Acidoferrales bacterium]